MKHGRGWEGAASESDADAHMSVLRLSFFFFFSRIRTDSALIRAKPGRFDQNRAISAKLGHIGQRPK